MPKPISLTIQFQLPEGCGNVKATISPSGEIVFTDEHGNIVVPEYMDRAVQYSRSKGPKIQSRQKVVGNLVTVSGLSELTKYDSVFVTDANTRTLGNREVSAACFICFRFHPEGEKVRIESEGKLNIYEFHEVPENPEMLAILKVARDVHRSGGEGIRVGVAFVTDSELGNHDDINLRRRPIYGNHYLPEGFSLHYASSDTGQEGLNRLIRFCDKQASKYLTYLEEGTVKRSPLRTLEEDPRVLYRYMFRDDLEIVNPVVGGIRTQPGTTVSLYGLRST